MNAFSNLRPHTLFSTIILLMVCFLIHLPKSYAVEVDNTARVRGIDTQTLIDLESKGLLKSSRDGSLGNDLWHNQSRDEVIWLLTSLPSHHTSQTLRKLQRRLLLTQTQPTKLFDEQSKEPKPGQNLITARLEKLIEMGFFADAFRFFDALPKDKVTPSLARLGLSALLLDGKFSTACLEEKALRQTINFKDPFWKDLRATCSIVIEEEQEGVSSLEKNSTLYKIVHNEGYKRLLSNTKSLSNLNNLEIASLFEFKKITLSNKANIEEFPGKTLALLTQHHALPDKTKNAVYQLAFRKGLISEKNLKEAYLSIEIPENVPEWSLHAHAYQRLQDNLTQEEQWKIAADILKTPISIELMDPFISILAQSNPNKSENPLTSQQVLTAIAAFLHKNIDIPRHWATQLDTFSPKNPDIFTVLHLLETTGYIRKKSNGPVDNLRKSTESLAINESEQVLLIKRFLDKKKEIFNNPLNVYEKHFYLTSDGGYVMPSFILLDRLRTAEKNRQTGLAVLIGLNILTASPERYHPAALMSIAQSLANVGLEKEVRELMKEIMTNFIKTKGE